MSYLYFTSPLGLQILQSLFSGLSCGKSTISCSAVLFQPPLRFFMLPCTPPNHPEASKELKLQKCFVSGPLNYVLQDIKEHHDIF